ncbi:MAG: MarR family transcriptional regulator [Lachnospiraceae bacterium]|nr:MarR family transcriptional regulator [Lachnospiraceae bacterium]
MVSNRDLFRKMMSLPKVLSMMKMKEMGQPPFGMGGKPGFGGPGGAPFQPQFGMGGKPGFGGPGGAPFQPPFGMGGKPGFGGPERPGQPGFGGLGCRKGPAGPMGRGMSRERLLTIISEYPDGIRQKDLAEAAGINASSASEVVSRLEDDGYLVRVIDESDKRATLLKLTEMGAVRAEEIRSERDSFLDDLFGRLTEDEKQTLSDLLDKLLGKE